MNNVWTGAAAGAVGTVALDVATYADMALRGRPASSMTARLVAKLAQRAGIESLASEEPDERTKSRQNGIGSLLGYANGIGVGLVYGALRPALRGKIPLTLAAVSAGASAMWLTDGTAVALGATDLAEWDRASWLSDIIPHLIFGFATALAFEALSSE